MPLSTTVGHLVEHLLAPPGDRHVEGIVAAGLAGLVVPHLQRFEQRLLRRRQAEIDHHGRAAGKRRARAALEIVGRIGAHEGHFEMGVRVDAARHDVAAGGVELVVAVQVRADADDLAVLEQHVGLPGAVGGDDGAVLDDFGHSVPHMDCSSGRSIVQGLRSSMISSAIEPAHGRVIQRTDVWLTLIGGPTYSLSTMICEIPQAHSRRSARRQSARCRIIDQLLRSEA